MTASAARFVPRTPIPHPQPESGSRHHSDWDPDPHCHFDAHTLADRIAYADVCAVALSDEHSAAFSAHSQQSPPPTLTHSDLNQDGRVDVIDVQVCANVFLGNQSDPVIIARADVNLDGRVDVRDVRLVVNALLSG